MEACVCILSRYMPEAQRHARQWQQKLKQKQKVEVVDEAAAAALQAAVEKLARDRDLNHRQQEEAGQRAVQAQVRQMIKLNRMPRNDGEVRYHFQDGATIRVVPVTPEVHVRLAPGQLAINPSCNDATGDREDDLYAKYRAPDDLMWQPVAVVRFGITVS